MDVDFLHDIFGPSPRSIRRWYQLFITKGVVDEQEKKQTKSRWPEEVLQAVANYCKKHPTFYLEELQDFLIEKFDLKNVSLSTICRALNHDLKLSRKVLTKAASEAAPLEIRSYMAKLRAIYHYPAQLVFIDETSKDGRHEQLETTIHQTGARLLYLPPYAPQLNCGYLRTSSDGIRSSKRKDLLMHREKTNKVEIARGSSADGGKVLQDPSNLLSGGTTGLCDGKI